MTIGTASPGGGSAEALAASPGGSSAGALVSAVAAEPGLAPWVGSVASWALFLVSTSRTDSHLGTRLLCGACGHATGPPASGGAQGAVGSPSQGGRKGGAEHSPDAASGEHRLDWVQRAAPLVLPAPAPRLPRPGPGLLGHLEGWPRLPRLQRPLLSPGSHRPVTVVHPWGSSLASAPRVTWGRDPGIFHPQPGTTMVCGGECTHVPHTRAHAHMSTHLHTRAHSRVHWHEHTYITPSSV